VIGFALGAATVLLAVWLRGRLAGFAAQASGDYAGGPVLDIRSALNGALVCEGVIHGPDGRARSRFAGEIQAVWQGSRCRMAEVFRYDGGAVDRRDWVLDLAPDGTISAAATDLVGRAIGRQRGSALVLRYRIRLAPDAGGHVLSVTDWMYATPGGSIVNRSQFRKWGVLVAELVATIRPAPVRDAERCRGTSARAPRAAGRWRGR